MCQLAHSDVVTCYIITQAVWCRVGCEIGILSFMPFIGSILTGEVQLINLFFLLLYFPIKIVECHYQLFIYHCRNGSININIMTRVFIWVIIVRKGICRVRVGLEVGFRVRNGCSWICLQRLIYVKRGCWSLERSVTIYQGGSL